MGPKTIENAIFGNRKYGQRILDVGPMGKDRGGCRRERDACPKMKHRTTIAKGPDGNVPGPSLGVACLAARPVMQAPRSRSQTLQGCSWRLRRTGPHAAGPPNQRLARLATADDERTGTVSRL